MTTTTEKPCLSKLTIRRVWADYHIRRINEAKHALTRTHDHVQVVTLLQSIDSHTTRLKALDREAESADRGQR